MTKNALHARLSYLRNAEAVLALALPGALAWHWWRSGAAVDWALRLPPAVLVGLWFALKIAAGGGDGLWTGQQLVTGGSGFIEQAAGIR